MTMQYDENMGGWYDDGQPNDFAAAPDTAPAQSLAVQPAPDQSLAVQPAPTVKSGMVVDRGMGPNADDPYNGMGPPDLAVTPAIGGQDFAVNPQSATPDYAAYTNAYPDLAAAAQAAGMDPATFGAMHYAQSGKTEGRAVPPIGAAPTDPSLAVRGIGATGAAPIDTSNFAVFGNTGIKYGVDPSGQAFFNNQPISAEDYAVLTKNAAANPSLAVKEGEGQDTAPVNIAEGVRFNPEGLTDPATPTVSTTPASAAAFDYSSLVTGEPQLQNGPLQLNGGRTFNAQGPYYAPRTNSGDAAGAVYAGAGQKVRMRDPVTGDIVFEGVGPEGAKQATAIADAMSVNKGKKASWEIQSDGGDQGWQTMAADAVDTKHNLLGTLADIALPIIGVLMALPTGGLSLGLTIPASLGGAAMAAGLGAAAGSTLSSVAQGRSLGDTLTRAAISGVAAGVGGPLLSKVPGMSAVTSTLAKVPGVNWLATGPSVFGSGAGAGAGAITSTVLPNIAGSSVAAAGSMTPAMIAGRVASGVLTPAAAQILTTVAAAPTAAAAATAVEELIVTAGLSRAAAQGLVSSVISGGTGALTGSSGPNTMRGGDGPPAKPDNLAVKDPLAVEEVVVTGQNPAVTNAVNAAGSIIATNPMGSAGPPADFQVKPNNQTATNQTAQDNTVSEVVVIPMSVAEKLSATLGTLTVAELLAKHPEYTREQAQDTLDKFNQDKKLVSLGLSGLTLGAGLLGGSGASGGGGGSGGASSLQQQRASLSPTFSAQLGAPRGMFSALGSAGTPYNPRPISNITPGYAVRPTGTTGTTDTSSYGDVNGDGVIDAADAAIVNYYLSQQGGMPQFSVGGPIHGYAHGSSTRRDFAVQGPGTGRSDSIPAVLSDGEYVMDAETVALLGDGSSKAGARRLDQFRTNLRRAKGRNLAKGRFSVNAKAPEAYLSGGRT